VEPSKYSTYDIRVRAVKAALSGQQKTDVAMAYQVDYSTLYRWCQRYEHDEDFSILERKSGSGRPNTLDIKARKQLSTIIMKPASRFGYETDFWTCRRLIQVTERKLKITVSKPTMWRILRDMGLTYQKPERRYLEADDGRREKWIRYQVPKIRRTVVKYRAILYFQDESNISLTAVLGKTWSPKGKTPIQRVTGNRGGVSAMSAISKSCQLVFRLHPKRITSVEVIDFLAQLLKHHPARHLVIVMDQATPHISRKTTSFIHNQKRLHAFYLPSHSPDLNPDEQVWNHLKHQELKGHQARTKVELNQLAHRKLNGMSKNRTLLNGIFFRCCIANLLK
jgi:transposase